MSLCAFDIQGLFRSGIVPASALAASLLTACISAKSKSNPQPAPEINLGEVNRPVPAISQKSACGASSGSGKARQAYLFSMDEVCALKPVVLPEESGTTKEVPAAGEVDPRFSQWSQFTENFMNAGMQLPALSPGRSFRIFVIASDSENAQARGNLFFNSVLIEKASRESMAFIACHEAAHEARNHRKIMAAEIDRLFVNTNPDAAVFGAKYDDFKKNRFDLSQREYLHSQAAVEDLAQIWKKMIKEMETVSQRSEAEADVAAMKICTEIGFRLEELTAGFFDFFEPKVARAEETFRLEDGRYPMLEGKTEDDVILMILMSYMKSHPTPHERLWQFEDVFPAFGETQAPKLADQWRDNYNQQKPSQLALSVAEPNYVELFIKLKGAVARHSGGLSDGCSFGSGLGAVIAQQLASQAKK